MNHPQHLTSFAANWRKLPDELKLKVLRHALPSNKTFSELAFKKRKRRSTPEQGIIRRDVLPLLACPEIADLALEVFYVQNTFRIMFAADYSALCHAPLCPPPSVRKHVRRVNVIIHACADAFEALRAALASGGGLGFPNLHYVELTINGTFSCTESAVEIYQSVSTVLISTRMLKVTYYRCSFDYVWHLTGEAWVEQHRLEMFLEKVVMGKVEMVNRDKKAREKWLRYYYGRIFLRILILSSSGRRKKTGRDNIGLHGPAQRGSRGRAVELTCMFGRFVVVDK
jgi:hypothetical protein